MMADNSNIPLEEASPKKKNLLDLEGGILTGSRGPRASGHAGSFGCEATIAFSPYISNSHDKQSWRAF
jgi:hypothetical protein